MSCRRCGPAQSCCRRRCSARSAKALIGGPLGEIQKAHPDTIIGSYPKYQDGSFWTELVVRARTEAALESARRAVEAMVAGFAAAAAARV